MEENKNKALELNEEDISEVAGGFATSVDGSTMGAAGNALGVAGSTMDARGSVFGSRGSSMDANGNTFGVKYGNTMDANGNAPEDVTKKFNGIQNLNKVSVKK